MRITRRHFTIFYILTFVPSIQERQDLDARIAAIIEGKELVVPPPVEVDEEPEPEVETMYDPENPTEEEEEEEIFVPKKSKSLKRSSTDSKKKDDDEDQVIDDDELHNMLGI